MRLTRHRTERGARWAVDDVFLSEEVTLAFLLRCPKAGLPALLDALPKFGPAQGPLLAPIDPDQEVWAAGVTYLRSREARQAESSVADVYERVYDAKRPELFFKSPGRRVVGHGQGVRIRPDATWSVPEPELTLVINADGEIVGYAAGDDLSSRDIEGENPLYLPQAKVFDGSCAVGPGIELAGEDAMLELPISLEVRRQGTIAFAGETSSSRMKRPLSELVEYLRRDLAFPKGVLLLTGTGIVPPEEFSLKHGDVIRIAVGTLLLENRVEP